METEQAAVALGALAQESRLRVFRLLVPAGNAGLAAGEIAQALKLPAATLTFHLKELRSAGLIQSQRDGRFIRYSLRISGMQELLDFLARDCCQGHPDLCGYIGRRSCKDHKSKRAQKVSRVTSSRGS